MFFDPIYMLVAGIGMLLVFIPQMFVKKTYAKFSKISARAGITGAQVAREILAKNNITGVEVASTPGELTDHYDPSRKIIRLSEENYHGSSVAALGVAAHEVGHVIQDYRGYLPMKLRAGIFPAVSMGQMFGPILIMIGMGLRYFAANSEFATMIALTGIIFYASVAVFHLVTLPVEFDASRRAVIALADGGYVREDELSGSKQVLSAAAMTYVATALYAIIEVLYWAWVFFGRGRD